jgi:hypothetical protein
MSHGENRAVGPEPLFGSTLQARYYKGPDEARDLPRIREIIEDFACIK